jgi:hypothetical protein
MRLNKVEDVIAGSICHRNKLTSRWLCIVVVTVKPSGS